MFGVFMDVKKEFEEKYTRQETLKIQLDAYMKEREEVNRTLNDLIVTEAAIGEIVKEPKGAPILTNIGSGAFVKTSLENTDNILVSIGSGVVIEVSPKEARAILTKRIEQLRKIDFEYVKRMNELGTEIDKLQGELERLSLNMK
jgi:prefoldin alpha subunit